MNKQTASLLFAGLIPIVAFTLIEEYYGTIAGLIAGMFFGGGEILYELIKYKKVSAMTWIGNALLLTLGGISLISSDGIWFKLQPALMEIFFALLLFISWIIKKPFLVSMIEMQNVKMNRTIPDFLKKQFSGVTLRMSFFFFIQSIIATYAAFFWSTTAWAWLKGAGVTVSMIIYLIGELLWIRYKIKKHPMSASSLINDTSSSRIKS